VYQKKKIDMKGRETLPAFKNQNMEQKSDFHAALRCSVQYTPTTLAINGFGFQKRAADAIYKL